MNANYSHMRPAGFGWVAAYVKKMGKEAFDKLLNQRYGWLMAKTSGWTYDITVSKNLKTDADKDLFVKTVCLFISEGNDAYEFTEDYTIIRRR